jgi:hypothetical protein
MAQHTQDRSHRKGNDDQQQRFGFHRIILG